MLSRIDEADIRFMTQSEMASKGYPEATSGWYMTVKHGTVRGYLRIAYDDVDAPKSLMPVKSWRVRSRRPRHF